MLAATFGPLRVRLFDFMDRARVTGAPDVGGASAEKETTRTIGFEPDARPVAWLAKVSGRDVHFVEDPWSVATLVAAGGVHGGALRLGPGLPEDLSYLSLLVPARPRCRYVLRGRVKLSGHPAADESSAREVVRLLELTGRPQDPRALNRFSPAVVEVHRASRELDPSGWDRFELEIPLTNSATDELEIRLLQRSGGSADAATWFDDVELVEKPLSPAQAWQLVIARHRPEGAAPGWRLRVELPADGGIKNETRDALLLPPPATLALPLTIPPAAAGPVLRFAYGMLPEAFGAPGDGASLRVSFAPQGGEAVALATLDFDPKRDEAQRCWLHARVDLAPVAGKSGELRFESVDRGEKDDLPAVLIATPRIEPSAPAAAPEGGPPNVLLMASDTLRADHLDAFGYGRPTAPNLRRLAERGVRFARTRSQAPWTLPSFSSILTSLPPSIHGAGRGGHDEWTPLDPGVLTLAEVFARAGYETAGITANHLISPEYGLDRGFEEYAVPGSEEWRRIGLESVSLDGPLVVHFLEEHVHTPFFLFWHMMDPHLPYTTPAEVRARFVDPGYHGRFDGDDPIVPFQVLDPRPGRRWFTQEGPPKPPPLTDADKRFVSDYYDAEIGEIDDAIGTVLEALQRTGLAKNTIVAMVADHGEGLGEHGHYHHGYTLFEDQIHIPFILATPAGPKNVTIELPVASLDIAPTLLGAAGVPVPADFRGRDLHALGAPAAAGDESPDAVALSAEPVYCEYPSYDSSAQKACVLGDFKYLHDPWFHTEALYDTRRDPLEREDVRAAHPEVVKRARALLDEFRWEGMQRGRFHLRLRGRAGARLRLEVATDDLFDANFSARPLPDEHDFTLDFDRRHLVLETVMTGERFELVTWCRGERLVVTASLDGKPLAGGIRLGAEQDERASPLSLARGDVPTAKGETLAPPRPEQLQLWLEAGAGQAAPVVPSPAELELLRRLGYAH